MFNFMKSGIGASKKLHIQLKIQEVRLNRKLYRVFFGYINPKGLYPRNCAEKKRYVFLMRCFLGLNLKVQPQKIAYRENGTFSW